jgi:hypothetical protein
MKHQRLFFVLTPINLVLLGYQVVRPSAPSSLNFGVEPLQFYPSVFDAELPVDAALLGIRFVRPRCDLELKLDQFTDAAVAQALARQATQLALGDIQPTSVFRSVAEVDPFDMGATRLAANTA